MSAQKIDHGLELAKHQIRISGLTQEELAKALNASQSQVSRILSGRASPRSKLLNKICVYASSAVTGVNPALVRDNESLISALTAVWDGTPDHAESLSAVIRSLVLLSPQGPKSSKPISRSRFNRVAKPR